jgi:hypothetical protein
MLSTEVEVALAIAMYSLLDKGVAPKGQWITPFTAHWQAAHSDSMVLVHG